MSRLRFSAARYAILLIGLLAIAAVAVVSVLGYVGSQIDEPHLYRTIAVSLWVLTMGFMLIVGAFGIRAVQFGVLAEARRHIGHFISALDVICDGVLWMDDQGRILAMNPAARHITDTPVLKPELALPDLFPGLSAEETLRLRRPVAGRPVEIERAIVRGPDARTLRLRSHAASDGILLFVSDISDLELRRQHARQSSRMQLIGEITRGVARDFSTLMCSLSGDAYLLTHAAPGDAAARQAATRIARASERGNSLASRLLDLGQVAEGGHFTVLLKDHIGMAAESLRGSLPPDWSVDVDLPSPDFPPLPITGSQIEQIIVHLGHLAASAARQPGRLRIQLAVSTAPAHSGGVLTIAEDSALKQPTPEGWSGADHESGAIQSIIHGMLRDAGGDFHHLTTPDGVPVFSVILPPAVPRPAKSAVSTRDGWPPALQPLRLLLAGQSMAIRSLEAALRNQEAQTAFTPDFVGLLSALQSRAVPDVVILDIALIRADPTGLIKVLLQTHPATGVVLLAEDPPRDIQALSDQITIALLPVSSGRLPELVESADRQARRRHPIREMPT